MESPRCDILFPALSMKLYKSKCFIFVVALFLVSSYFLFIINGLHSAAISGNISMARVLISLGANVDDEWVEDNKLVTPLQTAIIAGNADFVKFLLSQGANVNGFDHSEMFLDPDMYSDSDKTPLSLAIEYDRLLVV